MRTSESRHADQHQVRQSSDLTELRAAIAEKVVAWRPDAGPDAGPDERVSGNGGADPWQIASQSGLHEWFAGGLEPSPPRQDRGRRPWLPPMAVLIGLAWKAVESDPWGRVVWVGRRCRPYQLALVRREGVASGDRRLLDRSVFVDTAESRAGHRERVWAIELAARCVGVGAVIADGSGLTMAESRRLQFAAAGGVQRTGVPVLIARPPWEQRDLSAARTRWRVSHLPAGVIGEGGSRRQGWAVELLRCKGLRPALMTGGARRWTVRRDHATEQITMETEAQSPGDGGVDAQVVHGPGSAARPVHRARTA